MSITKDKMEWDCVSNHLPDWIEDNDFELMKLVTANEKDIVRALVSESTDFFFIYGFEARKEEIIKEIIAIYERHLNQLTNQNK